MSLLQINHWVCQWNNFENGLTFGEVMGKSLVCYFLTCVVTEFSLPLIPGYTFDNRHAVEYVYLLCCCTCCIITLLDGVLWWAFVCDCVCRCLFVSLSLKTLAWTSPSFCACYLWSWLSPALVAARIWHCGFYSNWDQPVVVQDSQQSLISLQLPC